MLLLRSTRTTYLPISELDAVALPNQVFEQWRLFPPCNARGTVSRVYVLPNETYRSLQVIGFEANESGVP